MPDTQKLKSCRDRRVLHAWRSLLMNPKLKVKQLAKSVGLSESRLEHLIAEHAGTTIRDLKRRIKNERLHEARRQLLKSFRPIKEIRNLAGYIHDSNFIRDFKELFHGTPAVFRRKGQQQIVPKKSRKGRK